MGKQSARIRLNGKDHKEIRINGKYHKLADRDSNVLWEKIAEEPIVYDGFHIKSRGGDFTRFKIRGDVTINWGDGTIESYNYDELTQVSHYMNAYTYVTFDVWVSGNVIDMDFNKAENIIGLENELPATMSWKTDFSYMFANIDNIVTVSYGGTSINSNLFKNCVNAKDFSYCFYKSAITGGVPEGLFDSCIKAKDFTSCFEYATLERVSLPNNLFYYNSLATTFDRCFANTNVYLPNDLFKNCYSAVSMKYCFQLVDSIVSIPEGFFDDLINLEDISYCFATCKKLETVPYDLFDNCNNLKIVTSAFSGNNGTITSKVPPLWERTDITEYEYCYAGCYNAENYLDIPYEWR